MTRSSTKKRPAQRSTFDQPDLGPVEQIAIDLLKPYPGNARTHDEK